MRPCLAVAFVAACAVAATPLLPDPEYFATEKEAVEALMLSKAARDGAGRVTDGAALDKQTGADELTYAMERGWWTLAQELMATYRAEKVDLTAALYNTASRIRRKVQKLQDSLQKQKFTRMIAPAFRWAQSPSTVYVEQKFSHKWDTPATLGCKQERFHVEGRRLSFHAMCKDKRKRFQLELDLFRPIDPETSAIAFNSVGRATITLGKASNASWPRLLKKRGSKPGNMHTWHDMRERFEQQLRDFESKARNTSKDDAEAAKAADAPNATEVSSAGATTPAKTDADAEPAAAEPAVAAPTAEPTPTPEEAAAAARAEALDAALKRIERREADELLALRHDARKRKAAVDAEARKTKIGIDADLKSKSDEVKARFRTERSDAMKASEAEAPR